MTIGAKNRTFLLDTQLERLKADKLADKRSDSIERKSIKINNINLGLSPRRNASQKSQSGHDIGIEAPDFDESSAPHSPLFA